MAVSTELLESVRWTNRERQLATVARLLLSLRLACRRV